MQAAKRDEVTADVLIVGSGLSGLLAAIELAGRGASVVLASKRSLADANTSYAQGGVAAVLPGAADSVEQHVKDTLDSGAGLALEPAVWAIISEGASLIRRLRELGVGFDIGLSGRLDTAREGGHSQARVIHNRDATGRAVMEALLARLTGLDNVLPLKYSAVIDLIVADGRVCGALVLLKGRLTRILARHTVLATGGIGAVYARSTNPDIATGDGIALAYRAGARIVDMEFVQFHPTAFCRGDHPAYLISEAVRGAGAVLVDAGGGRFMKRFHEDGELATRDVVARAIHTIMSEQGRDCVWLDMRPIGAHTIASRFPNIVERCRAMGLDPLTTPVPVAPAAHYSMGGIETDMDGRTSVPALYAAGECACTGLHGANRLASNSLLEAGVMAVRVAAAIARAPQPALSSPAGQPSLPLLTVPADPGSLRSAMYRWAGLRRDSNGLRMLANELSVNSARVLSGSAAVAEASSIHLVARLIAEAAAERLESRGAHWRDDYPQTDDSNFRRRRYASLGGCGWIGCELEPEPFVQHHGLAAPPLPTL